MDVKRELHGHPVCRPAEWWQRRYASQGGHRLLAPALLLLFSIHKCSCTAFLLCHIKAEGDACGRRAAFIRLASRRSIHICDCRLPHCPTLVPAMIDILQVRTQHFEKQSTIRRAGSTVMFGRR